MEQVVTHYGEIIQEHSVEWYKKQLLEDWSVQFIKDSLLPQLFEWSNAYKAAVELTKEKGEMKMTNEQIKQIEQVEEKGETKMAEEIIEEVEEIEEAKTTGKYIPADELAESKRIMAGRTMYTINKDFMIVETKTVRCNPSSYDYNALKLFLENNKELLEDYFNSDDNYGIGFYACGYDGRAQQEFAQDWADSGVRVF